MKTLFILITTYVMTSQTWASEIQQRHLDYLALIDNCPYVSLHVDRQDPYFFYGLNEYHHNYHVIDYLFSEYTLYGALNQIKEKLAHYHLSYIVDYWVEDDFMFEDFTVKSAYFGDAPNSQYYWVVKYGFPSGNGGTLILNQSTEKLVFSSFDRDIDFCK